MIYEIYGFQGLNHQIIEESLDVTPLTYKRTDGKWKIVQYSELNQKPLYTWVHKVGPRQGVQNMNHIIKIVASFGKLLILGLFIWENS